MNNKPLEIQDVGSSYQIIDLDILVSTYSAIACPDCFNTSCVELEKAKKKKQGLLLQLCLSCMICEFRYPFWTSKKAEKMRSYGINKQSVYAFRRLGKGYAGMKTFLTIMNLPTLMTKKSFKNCSDYSQSCKDCSRIMYE